MVRREELKKMNWEKISYILLSAMSVFIILLLFAGVVGWIFEFILVLIHQDLTVFLVSLWAVVVLIIWWFLE